MKLSVKLQYAAAFLILAALIYIGGTMYLRSTADWRNQPSLQG